MSLPGSTGTTFHCYFSWLSIRGEIDPNTFDVRTDIIGACLRMEGRWNGGAYTYVCASSIGRRTHRQVSIFLSISTLPAAGHPLTIQPPINNTDRPPRLTQPDGPGRGPAKRNVEIFDPPFHQIPKASIDTLPNGGAGRGGAITVPAGVAAPELAHLPHRQQRDHRHPQERHHRE